MQSSLARLAGASAAVAVSCTAIRTLITTVLLLAPTVTTMELALASLSVRDLEHLTPWFKRPTHGHSAIYVL